MFVLLTVHILNLLLRVASGVVLCGATKA